MNKSIIKSGYIQDILVVNDLLSIITIRSTNLGVIFEKIFFYAPIETDLSWRFISVRETTKGLINKVIHQEFHSEDYNFNIEITKADADFVRENYEKALAGAERLWHY